MDDISKVEVTNWYIGKQRVDIIKPLAEISICPRKKILEAANTLKLSERYIYKLIRNYPTHCEFQLLAYKITHPLYLKAL